MRQKNGRLIALVAAVAVAAIAIGGALAYRQSPQNAAEANAAPLSGSPPPTPSTPIPTPTATPSKTPIVKPSQAPTKSGALKTKIDLAKLDPGRAPQITYLSGRTVRGGPGQAVKVPGSGDIWAVGRLSQSVLAVVSKGGASELLTIDSSGQVIRRTPDVNSIVTTEDGLAAAYVATRTKDTGEQIPGATVYAEQKTVSKIELPNAFDARPLAYVNGKVYIRTEPDATGSTWTLYEWVPGTSKATAVKTVPQPTAVTGDGTTAASLTNLTDYKSCTNVVAVATGKRLWRTCDYQIDGFTRDGATAIAGPFYRDGYGDGIAAALDAKTGNLLHEWSGTFRQVVAEDDQHLLLLADDGEESPASLIRCTTTTGACERATPLAKGTLLIGS